MSTLELLQIRTWHTTETTISTLTLDNVPECYILEDMVRAAGVKVAGKTAIPPGRYEIVITPSPKFKRDLPRLFNVKLPDGRLLVQSEDKSVTFEGVLIHPGNTAAHTEGCLLPGNQLGVNRVNDSTTAFNNLFAKLVAAKAAGKRMFITIK
jgi:hypothetical protein